MAGELQFDLVSPERKLASVLVTSVQIPAQAGDMTAMAGHLPTITTLRTGVLRAHTAQGMVSFLVTGGFADITATSVTVLAERATPMEEVSVTLFDELVAEAKSLEAIALPDDKAYAVKTLADLIAMREAHSAR